MKLACIAVDDEPLALEKIRDYIDKVDSLDLLATFDNGISALEFLKERKVDVLFLDVQMEELTGIQLLESLRVKPKVILTTAYDTYTLQGYDLNVTDYLLKPFSFQRFLQAIDKVYDVVQTERNRMPAATENGGSLDYIFVRSESKYRKVNFADILFVEGMKDYIRIHTVSDRLMTLNSFSSLTDHLPADRFIRVHKSYMVSISRIDSIERNTVLIGEYRIPIGESYRKHFFYILKKNQLIL
jgi:DNA-binding LytR/AlgR family response regulator